MNLFFKIVLPVWASVVFSTEVLAQTQAVANPDDPAPPASMQVKIPHSKRTKDNIMDSILDFTFTRFFKTFKKADVSYGFFEIKGADLNFTDFTVKLDLPDVRGTVVIPGLKIGLNEFLAMIKNSKAYIPSLELTGASAHLTLNEGSGEKKKKRVVQYSARKMTLEKVTFASITRSEEKSDFSIGSAEVVKAVLNISNPSEKYAVSSGNVKNLVWSETQKDKITFSAAEVDGIMCTDTASLLRALRK